MIPKRVELENFLSFGSPPVEIAFADDEPLWVVSGPNGVGKSAVFDAITYCLFGCHRGTGNREAKVEELIHHGANGFKVTFDFEFAGTDYRITRTRGGRTTQRVEQRDAATGEWKPVTGINSSADVKAWAERMLGLGFEAFQASVLLRQGEADKILTAGPTDRGAILRKIIGADRYKGLGERVHGAAKRCSDRLEDLQGDLTRLEEVSAEAVAAAEGRLAKAETDRALAHQQAKDSDQRVAEAKQWACLAEKLRAAEKDIADADARAQDAERIRTDQARLDELTRAVPVLQQIVKVRATLAAADQAVTDRQAEADRVAAALRALELKQEIDDADKFVQASDAAAGFPADLADQVTAAQAAATVAAEARTGAGQRKAAIEALLKQVKGRQSEFAKVDVGVKCSRCGQTVAEEHARREREDIDRQVEALKGQYSDAVTAEEKAVTAKAAADKHLATLTRQQEQQRKAAERLAELTRTRTERGLSVDAESLRDTLSDRRQALKQAEADAGDQVSLDRKVLERRKPDVSGKLIAAQNALANDRGREITLTGQLAPDWQASLDDIDRPAVDALEQERQAYVTAGVTGRFHQLECDAAQREVWVKQRDGLARDIAGIPETSRVPVAHAECDAASAHEAARERGEERDAAKTEADRLAGQRQRRLEAAAAVKVAERQADLHRKLDDLLGKDGLQRELVRSAEREIVRYADDTLRHLSDGDLTVELVDDPAGDDAAFSLQVRRAEDPEPIGVHYLSGSQKFRVAVAVALAIGRYAAGQARPLESVIIDEGFGSLDRDGLDAMAEELNRLKQYLRRIVLVSHQEEFAERFRAVIRLSRGEGGTVAKADRL